MGNIENKSALTIREISRMFGFPEYAVRTLVKEGRFPVIQVGTRSYIVKAVFEDFLATGGERYEPKH